MKTEVQGILSNEYDYIVVGAGSTGCVVACRLSENSQQTVLILEAGGDDLDFPDIAIPAKTPMLQKTELDWDYKTVPQQKSSLGLINQQSTWPRGRVLGGSSCLNYMAYMRGSPEDYNCWASMGCDGWSYPEVLPYFKKSENNTNDEYVRTGYHARGGPLTVADVCLTPLSDAFVSAAQELGYRSADCNSGDALGFMRLQSTICDGERMNTARVFLRPVMHRLNLHIATYAHVTKIQVDEGKASAVHFTRNEEKQKITARREIILCSGTIGSAQILLLSGIGPRAHLQDMKIPIVTDLPVGEFLQDHLEVWGMQFEIDQPLGRTDAILSSPDVHEEYEKHHRGPLASIGLEGASLIRTHIQDPTNPMPDAEIELIVLLFGTSDDPPIKHGRGIRDDIWDAMFGGMKNKQGFTLMPVLSHPKSRGTLRLKSNNPDEYPILDPQYLSHPDDVKTFVEAIKICLRLGDTETFKKYGCRFIKRWLPDYKGGPPFTDDYWEYHVRHLAQTVYHHVGTCKMGRSNDPTAVVDPQLRVKGIKQLRVADASIIPEVTSANINATCIMIGEKVADLIKGETIPPFPQANI